MGKHLSLYRSILEYNNDTNREIPNVSYIKEESGNKIFYYHAKENSQFPEFPNYPGGTVNGKNYLRFRAVTDSTISIKQSGPSNTVDIKYSYDGQNWIQWNYLKDTISLSKGAVVYMKGNNSSGFNTSTVYKYFSMTGKIASSGNIMSLLYEDDFEGKLTIPCECCYYRMFFYCTSLTTAPELPATTLAESCYHQMFRGCTSLTTAPELPATTLAEGCYNGMFSNCTILRTAPELPATTLADYCYYFMFYNCSSLTTAPVLPATTLDRGCYEHMFYNCTSLNHIKMLATDISDSFCLYDWVYNVANNGIFVKHPNMNSLPAGSDGIPEGWSVNIEIDYKKFSIINNSNNEEIIFYYNGGIYSPIKGNHIDLYNKYDKNTIYSFTPEIDLIIDIYKVSQNNIGILKLTDVVWGSGASLESLCYTYNINDLDGILIIIKSADCNYNGYGYYGYYDSPEIGMHVYYSKDNGNTWIGDIYSYGESFTIDVNQGDTIMFKASRDGNDINTDKNIGGYLTFNIKSDGNITWKADNNSGKFSNSTASFDVSGNIMSLVYGDNFEDKNQLNASYIFSGIFFYTKVINAENLILPATTLAPYCYSEMFAACSSLRTAPELPATTLAKSCYFNMFADCTSLTTAPALPATTLADECYSYMFSHCTSLTTAPELPATTLAEGCYNGMFSNCTILRTAPELPATTLADYCYCFMFYNCSSLTTAPELPATTLAEGCYNGMFDGCTSLTTAPELPATTLAEGCYNGMFWGCNSLTTAPELPATTLAEGCYNGMFSYCKKLAAAPALPATTLAPYCYSSMFQGCTSLVTAPALPATTLTDRCYQSMFHDCTSLTTAPELPATILAPYCYNSMFRNCTSLNYIKMLATDISAEGCLSKWVYNVANNGTFIKHPNMNSLPTGDSGIPNGWSVQNASI